MKQLNNERSGFTLIELLVVIFIIGTLTAIILPNFVGSRQRARDSRRKQDLANLKNALRMYYNDNQAYPDTLNDTDLNSDYISSIPLDPVDNSSYGYCTDTNNNKFVLMASLENAGDSDGVTSQDTSACPSSLCTLNCPADETCYYICGS